VSIALIVIVVIVVIVLLVTDVKSMALNAGLTTAFHHAAMAVF
jgi:hypothetical protein